ncbi:hypothetical protein HYPSUDRAFT_69399 [Hypholoma sublateritium FD-334 SS-4]|uniref:N-acetyltransferase domain-containing protein n=1 Tax=Hypholoma sublateritium (strain FD-334 SS-4) TaxID=945553 RepID=A0A0D2PGL9_HYPSF|nr:hypothetical protein HYPSUDRAFT_69399 [Hypholoma sublateritium FD-334 SS-4]
MPPFRVQRVLNPTEARLAEAANLFTDLMKNNLGALSLAGGEASLMNYQALALLRVGSLYGEYYEATDDEGNLLGFTMWMPPGQEMFSTEEQRRLGFNYFMQMLSSEAENYFKTKYVAQFPGFVASLLGPRGKIDSWWLHMAMIRHDRQRKGVLRALVDIVRAKAEDAGEYLATCTTNDDNIRVYTGLGFAYKGSTEMESPWGKWPIHVFKMDFADKKAPSNHLE